MRFGCVLKLSPPLEALPKPFKDGCVVKLSMLGVFWLSFEWFWPFKDGCVVKLSMLGVFWLSFEWF